MDGLWSHLGISLIGIVSVTIATVILYGVIALVLQAWGQRLRASSSTASLALLTLLGSIAARATLGESPTLLGGLVAIATLLVLEQTFGRWSALFPRRRLVATRSPVVLLAQGQIRHRELTRRRMTEEQLLSELRLHGVRDLADVDLVILEPRGRVSVVRAGTQLSPALTRGIRGLPAG